MAFVWSRLALAALLAAGAACAQDASRCQGPCDELPRLACADEAPLQVTDCGDDAFDDPVIATASNVAPVPRTVIDLTPPVALVANAATGDVLDVAPKTSPPLS